MRFEESSPNPDGEIMRSTLYVVLRTVQVGRSCTAFKTPFILARRNLLYVCVQKYVLSIALVNPAISVYLHQYTGYFDRLFNAVQLAEYDHTYSEYGTPHLV